jgi:hypothetical protein
MNELAIRGKAAMALLLRTAIRVTPMLLIFGLTSAVDGASVYTCTAANGAKSFSDRPCKQDSAQTSQNTAPTSTPTKNTPAQRKGSSSYGKYVDRARSVDRKSKSAARRLD